MKKKAMGIILILAALLVFSAAPAETLTLPASLQIIDTEAFYGDSSISAVSLPENITEIRSKAFAESSLTSINLPGSLTFIAEDALPGPGQVQVTAAENSYAYDWAAAHGYFVSAPVQRNPLGQNRKIIVSWDAVEGADTYYVYYSTTQDIADAVEITGITDVTCTVENLEQGTTYYTWVRAFGPKGRSVPSDMKSTITYPSAPDLNEPVVSGNSITVTWDPVPGASVYRLNYNTVNDVKTASRIDIIRATEYTFTDLEYNTTYYFWGESANASGGMRKSVPVSATTGYDPAAPVQHAAEAYMRKITVSWDAFEGAESYSVYYGTENDIAQATEVTGITETQYVIENLAAGTTYYTWVKAVTAEGASKESNVMHALTYPAAPELNEPQVSGNTISLSWEAVTGADTYTVRYGTSDQYGESARVTDITETAYTLADLKFSTTYYIWMESWNASGGMRSSTPVEVTTHEDPLVPKQSEPKGGIRKITVSWEAVEGATSYNVYYGTENDISAATEVTDITATQHEIDNLQPGTTYYTWVKSVTAQGVSNASTVMHALTFPAVPVLNAPQISGNTIALSWEEVESANRYTVRFGTSDQYANAARITNIRDTSYQIIGLEFSTTYYIWMEAYNESGGVRMANPVQVMTEDDLLTPKQNAPAGGVRKITVSWEAVEGAESYLVYYSTSASFSSAQQIPDLQGSSYTIESLEPGTTYYTWVAAVTGGVESSPSNRKSVITAPPATTLDTPVVSGNSVTLTWTAVKGATRYYLKYGTGTDYKTAEGTTNYITDTTCTISDLAYDTTYNFWIASGNAAGSVINPNPVSAKTDASSQTE